MRLAGNRVVTRVAALRRQDRRQDDDVSSDVSTSWSLPVSAEKSEVAGPTASTSGSRRQAGSRSWNEEACMARARDADICVRGSALERRALNRSRIPWTRSNRFLCIVGLVIMSNALCMGLEVDHGREFPTLFLVLEHFFAAAFFAELVLHFAVEGVRSYFGESANWLDFTLVGTSVVDLWIVQQAGAETDMRMISLMRLLRLTRLARLFRLFRMFKELTLIVEGFAGGAKALAWIFFFLVIIVYAFALLARMQIGAKYICADEMTEAVEGELCPAEAGGGSPQFVFTFNEEIGDQDKLFGSVSLTMLTLFLCLTEGCGLEVIHPTVREEPWLAAFWVALIVVNTFGLINLIIGIFCDNMMRISLRNEQEIAESQEEARRLRLHALQHAFQRMDVDGTGDITREEYARAIGEDPEVVAALQALDMDDEVDLFDKIDADHSGTLEFQEFFDGLTLLMRGRSPALAKDMVSTYLRVSYLFKVHSTLSDRIEGMQEDESRAFATIDATLANMESEHLQMVTAIEGQLDKALGSLPQPQSDVTCVSVTNSQTGSADS